MTPDILVIGGGVFGLSAAFAAHRAGASVTVLEAAHPGAGSSGGVVGALTPHAPTRWRPMMAFQFAALRTLPNRVHDLVQRTGKDPGYRLTGRAAPIATEKALARAHADCAAASGVWGDAGTMAIRPAADFPSIHPDAAPYGVLFDTISALISPRDYLQALVAALPVGTIRSARVTELRPGPSVRTTAGDFAAKLIIVAAGWQGWALLPPPLRGRGVKGQAALLRVDPGDMPVVTHDGLYIIPHRVSVAVGSTSEKSWDHSQVDAGLDALLVKAAAAVPALAGAPVIERWAGIRPKPPGREPLVGAVPGLPGVWVAGGGFKIGFGIAHAVGDAVVAAILGQSPPIGLPDSFDPCNFTDGAET